MKRTAFPINENLHRDLKQIKAKTGKSLTWLIYAGMRFAISNLSLWIEKPVKDIEEQ